MDLSFSDQDEAFRAEVRAFIEANYTDELRLKNSQAKNGYIDKAGIVQWQKALHSKGWAAPNWPVEYGGPGFTATQKFLFDLEMGAADTPLTSPMGVTMVAPVIMHFGTDQQKADHLPKILSSDVWWCQGYSEPQSGSDLASLSLKAEDKGDHYVLNGSKIWTTHAQWADWMFCLVRTSVMDKPQRGISFLLFPMNLPGIEVAPINTLDGPVENEQEVNQVFFTDVKVDKSGLVGEQDDGWTCAKYLLQFERGNPYASGLKAKLRKIKKIASAEQVDGHRLIDDPDFARKIAQYEMEIEAMEGFELRFFSALSTGAAAGPESSILKTRGTELQQRATELALEAIGGYAAPFIADTFNVPTNDRPGPDYAAPVAPYYFNLRKATIYAGSNEIQRNIMSKHLLGL